MRGTLQPRRHAGESEKRLRGEMCHLAPGRDAERQDDQRKCEQTANQKGYYGVHTVSGLQQAEQGALQG
jgi:hypothetical protein